MRLIRAIFILLFLLTGSQLIAAPPDSTIAQDTSYHQFTMKKSPTQAVLLSLACPGLGQYYVESYWKVPLFVGGAVGCIYGIVSNNSMLNKKIIEVNNAIAANESPIRIATLKNEREYYRDNRDLAGLYLLAVYVVASVDAYTGAHLYDFDVSDNLSLRVLPDVQHGGFAMQLRW
ncbi:MAG: hypothetical protein HYZ54_00255 [Ignavibacteriae bacterium]|nr:hypothetical protein [Ignavibacteriota bacterium]